MDVYRRFFKVSNGPLIDSINDANKINAKAHKEYATILKEIGAKSEYYHVGHRLVGIIFDGKPDGGLYKKSGNGWMPKKNCKFGKELSKRIASVKTKDPQDAIETIGLSHSPTIFKAGRGYSSTLVVIPEKPPVAYVCVPWYDEDPKKLDEYKKERASGKHFSSTLDALLWEPAEGMKPVKEWEMKRHIEEWNESVKDKQQAT